MLAGIGVSKHISKFITKLFAKIFLFPLSYGFIWFHVEQNWTLNFLYKKIVYKNIEPKIRDTIKKI